MELDLLFDWTAASGQELTCRSPCGARMRWFGSLEVVWNLLHPFAQFTALIQGEEYTTISTVIPSIMDLNLHLQELSRHSEVGGVAKKLQSELQRRFKKYTCFCWQLFLIQGIDFYLLQFKHLPLSPSCWRRLKLFLTMDPALKVTHPHKKVRVKQLTRTSH